MEAGRGQPPEKHPQVADAPVNEKQPVSLGIDHEEAFKRQPVWRFADLNANGPPSSDALTAADLHEMHTKLGEYEKQTCAEIWGQHDNGCKRYDVGVSQRTRTSCPAWRNSSAMTRRRFTRCE